MAREKRIATEPINMKSSIGTFVLRFMATALLIARAAAAQAQGTGHSMSLCPPSFTMTEHDGCQKSNDSKYAVEQSWKEIVALITNTPSEIQACVRRGSLNMQSTQDDARAEISRCQRAVQVWRDDIGITREAKLRHNAEQSWKEIVVLIHNAPSEIQACVWRGPLNMQSTQDEAKAEISRCQRVVQVWREDINLIREENLRTANTKLRAANIANAVLFMKFIAAILVLVFAVGFRAKIAAGLYNLFVRCLALRLRFNRSRKRFLDNAIKEAENRLG